MHGDLATVGVEEEFHLVDLRTRRLVPRAPDVLSRLPAERFFAELQCSVVETNSRPHQRLEDLDRELRELRGSLVAATEPLGLGIAATGTVPLVDVDSVKVTANPRFGHMLGEYQMLVHEQLICSSQVHVAMPDRDLAVEVAARLAPALPMLLALSASSPYWFGADSGYASWRTLIWQRWPTAGPPGVYGSAAEYDKAVADLVRSGVITDPGMIYFDVRPSDHVPTIELRVCDACPRVTDVVLLAGLFRALVLQAVEAAAAGRPAPPRHEALLRAATWRAARSGLEGDLIDPVEGTPVPATRLLRRMLDELRPCLEAAGDWELVSELAEVAVRDGSAAARQRRAFSAASDLTAVVDLVLAETGEGTPAPAG